MAKKLLWLLAVALVILVLLIPLGSLIIDRLLPHFVNIDELVREVESSIEENSGMRADIESSSVHTTLFNGVQVVFNNSSFYDPEGIRLVKAADIVVNVRYIPLLSGKRSISKIVINDVEVYIGKDSFLFRLKKPKPPSEKIMLENTTLAVNRYRIIVDGFVEGVSRYYLEGVSISMSHLESPRIYQSKFPIFRSSLYTDDIKIGFAKEVKTVTSGLNGTIILLSRDQWQVEGLKGSILESPFALDAALDLKNRTLNLKAKTEKLDLKRLSELLLQLTPDRALVKRFNAIGEADINMIAKGPLREPKISGEISFHDVTVKEIKKGILLFKNLNGRFYLSDNLIKLDKISIFIDDSPLYATGTINRIGSILDLSLKSRTLNLDKVEEMINKIAPLLFWELPDWFKQFEFGGDLSNIDLKVRGRATNPSLYGHVDLDSSRIKDKISKLELSALKGGIDFTPEVIKSGRLEGQIQKIPFIASGSLSGSGYRLLNVGLVSSNLDISAISEIIKLVRPDLLQKVDLKGNANLDLKLTGKIESPVVTGEILLQAAQLAYLPKDLLLQGITGRLILSEGTIRLDTIHGILNDGASLLFDGTVDKDLRQYNVGVKGENIAITQLEEIVADFAPAVEAQIRQLAVQSGVADLNLILSPTFPQGIGGTVTLEDVYALPLNSSEIPVRIARFIYDIGTGRLQFPKGALQVGELQLDISGSASLSGYNIRIASQKIPVSFLRDKKLFVEKLIPVELPDLYNTSGALSLDTKLTPLEKEFSISFFDAGASMEELKYPVYNVNGTINLLLSGKINTYTDNLTLRYGNSPIKTSFDIDGLDDIYAESTGTLSPLLVNDFISVDNRSAVAYIALPFNFNLSGKVGSLSGAGKGNDLNMFFNFNATSLFSDLSMEKPVKAGDSSLDEATFSSVLHLLGDSLSIEKTRLRAGKDGSLLIEGLVKNLFTEDSRQLELSVVTDSVLDLADLAKKFNQQITEGLSGKMRTNLKLVSTLNKSEVTGNVVLNNVSSPGLNLINLDGRIDFNGAKAFLDIDNFEIPGVNVGFTATVDSLFQYPLPIVDFNMTGKQFIVSLYTEWINSVVIGKIRRGMWEQFFPNRGRLGSLPFEIKSGTIQLDEGIINNLIVENYASNIRVYPNTYFELDNAYAESAGGTASGHFAMNPRNNNFMIAHLVIDKMKANAVSRILLNVTNQIFGDLSGIIDFTTQGTTPEEMLANSDGFADLRIENGRLPSIAKIENLLVAANTISGGLANLNLNSLFRLAAPFDTEYFATLTGTFKMVEGIIHTDDMTSNGENLDLFMLGSVRMMDGFANLIVKGEMDREIGGVLGPLGDISLGRFLRILPPLRKLVGYIPGIGFIPGFGGPATEGVAFEVNLLGPILDPGSIRDFHWIQG